MLKNCRRSSQEALFSYYYESKTSTTFGMEKIELKKKSRSSSVRENYSKFARNKANIFLRVQIVIRVLYQYFTSLILHELKIFFNFFPIHCRQRRNVLFLTIRL